MTAFPFAPPGQSFHGFFLLLEEARDDESPIHQAFA
jgi:hypothetical protein